MFYLSRADALPDLTDVNGRMAQMISLYHNIVFLCRLISDDMIAMETVCL
jgi:hypothetical protein